MSFVAGVSLVGLSPDSPLKFEVLCEEDETFKQSFELNIQNDLQSTFSEIAKTFAEDLAFVAVSVPSYFTDLQRDRIETALKIPSFHKSRIFSNTSIVQLSLVNNDYDVRNELVIDIGVSGAASRLLSTEVEEGTRFSDLEKSIDVSEVLKDPSAFVTQLVHPMLEYLQERPDSELKRIVIVASAGHGVSKAAQAFADHLMDQFDPTTTEIFLESEVVHYTAKVALQFHRASKTPQQLCTMNVAPLRLGIAKTDGFVLTLIQRNNTFPSQKKAVLTTSKDNQTRATVRVVAGVAPRVEHNVVIGEFVLDNLPPHSKGVVMIQVEVIVQYDGPTQIIAEELGEDGYPKMGGARYCLDMTDFLGDGEISKDDIGVILDQFEVMEHDDKAQDAENIWAGEEAQGSLPE